ncbi:MAG: penicillin acylase family protein [Bacteroidota bacterium]
MQSIFRVFFRVMFGILLLLGILIAGGWVWLKSSVPTYEGNVEIPSMEAPAEVLFDNWGIPHITANSERDAFRALGYVQAQERLFQMEMLRRLASGRLAAVLGKDGLVYDRFMRTLGIGRAATFTGEKYFSGAMNQPWQQAALAYLEGVNAFVDNGPTPPEFTLLGIEKTHFQPSDMYQVIGYMALSFAYGYRLDPVMDKVARNLGPEYLAMFELNVPNGAKIPVYDPDSTVFKVPSMGGEMAAILDHLPMPAFMGSNAWVLGPQKSATGNVILANDPHIQFSQPAVWYEAQLKYPVNQFHGFFLAGFPFGIIGYNQEVGWGMTMFENDDMDFFLETFHSQDSTRVKFDSAFEEIKMVVEVMEVKGDEDVNMPVRITRHGPIVNDIISRLDTGLHQPVALYWEYLQQPSEALQACYSLLHSQGPQDIANAAERLHAPGLNLMFGDKHGNFGWYTTGHIRKYPEHVSTKLFLDGSGPDEPLGYLPFDKQPQSVNPSQGYIYSANNQPDSIDGAWVPGYYAPEGRARRIEEKVEAHDNWTMADCQNLQMDVLAPVHPEVVKMIVENIDMGNLDEVEQEVMAMLADWDGNHEPNSPEPVIYQKLIYHLLHNTLIDELGEKDFQAIASTFLMKNSLKKLLKSPASPWYDDINSPNVKESQEDCILTAIRQTVAELRVQLGANSSEWKWASVHPLTHPHALSRGTPLGPLVNVGPFPTSGGNEVLNNMGFNLNGEGVYPVVFGPSLRMIVEFDPSGPTAQAVLPTGQSGHLLGGHYDDQASLYNAGEYRKLGVPTSGKKMVLLPGE